MSGRRFFSRLNRRLWLGLLPCLLHTGALAAPPTPVIVAEALTKPFADRIEALGTLSANESVALTATVTETISVLHFDDGQRVPAGTVLVEMTSRARGQACRMAPATSGKSWRRKGSPPVRWSVAG